MCKCKTEVLNGLNKGSSCNGIPHNKFMRMCRNDSLQMERCL